MDTDELTAALRACAVGLYPFEAGTSISDGTTLMADIGWDAVITALNSGELPCSDMERRICSPLLHILNAVIVELNRLNLSRSLN